MSKKDTNLEEQIRQLMLHNKALGYCEHFHKHYSYTMPSPGDYHNQFFWDSCIHCIIQSRLGNIEAAKSEMRSLFAMQQHDGFVGHILFWENHLPANGLQIIQARLSMQQFHPHMSALMEPPLAAHALMTLFQCSGDKDFVHEMLPALKKYYDYLERERMSDNGLLFQVSAFESGMDWKPSYDSLVHFKNGKANNKLFRKIMWVERRNFLNNYNTRRIYRQGYFIIKEMCFNTVFADGLFALSELCKLAGEHSAAAQYYKLYESTSFAILNSYCDSRRAFFDLDGKTNGPIEVLTPTALFPMILDSVPGHVCDQMVHTHLDNPKEFLLNYPLPSVAVNEPSFEDKKSKFLWRGPVWAFNNWFLFKALQKRGYKQYADRVRQSLTDLVHKSGFREYYDPFNGEGYGAEHFTWPGLLLDMQ